jgi:lipopolysaccharide export system ATP-binding protein
MAGEELLRVEGLVKQYRGRRVVNGVSFRVCVGEIVGLLGPNGAGKTTSFRMTVGMIRADAGKVRLVEKEVTRAPMYRRARLGMGYLAQEPSVFRRLSVAGNILAVLELRKLSRAEQRRRCAALLEEFGLTDLAGHLADTLSGGECRRLEIARALATEPKLLLLDEPFSGIDPITVQEIQSILLELRTRGIGVLLTDHNVRDTLEITDRAYIIDHGEILLEGPPSRVVADERVRQVYLGERFEVGPRGVTPAEEARLTQNGDASDDPPGGGAPARQVRPPL